MSSITKRKFLLLLTELPSITKKKMAVIPYSVSKTHFGATSHSFFRSISVAFGCLPSVNGCAPLDLDLATVCNFS